MTNLILIALVQVSALGADQQDFGQAYQQSLTTERPLVVLLGARWCSACQKMKNLILPQVAQTGGLKNVVFTYVDFDRQRQLASRLSRARSIPQLIRFDRTPAGWKSKRLVGARSPRQVYDFINAGLIDKGKANEVSATDRPSNDFPRLIPAGPPRSTAATPTPKTNSLADPPKSHAGGVSGTRVKKAGGSVYWPAFFRKVFRPSRNRHDGTGHEQDRLSQAREDKEAGQSPRQRETNAGGSESGGGGADIADSLSALVSGG